MYGKFIDILCQIAFRKDILKTVEWNNVLFFKAQGYYVLKNTMKDETLASWTIQE